MANATSTRRIERLFEELPEGVDTVALSPGETMRYFTGLDMHKSERPTLVVLFRHAEPGRQRAHRIARGPPVAGGHEVEAGRVS